MCVLSRHYKTICQIVVNVVVVVTLSLSEEVLLVLLVLVALTFLSRAHTEDFEGLVVGGVLGQNERVVAALHVVELPREDRWPDNLGVLHYCLPLTVRILADGEVQDQRSDLLSHAGEAAARHDCDPVVVHGHTALKMEAV